MSGSGGGAGSAALDGRIDFGAATREVFRDGFADDVACIYVAVQRGLAVLSNRAQLVMRIFRDAKIDFYRFAIFQFRPLAHCRTLGYTVFGATSHSASIACVDETRQCRRCARNANDPLVTGRCVGFEGLGKTVQAIGRGVLVTPATTLTGECMSHP